MSITARMMCEPLSGAGHASRLSFRRMTDVDDANAFLVNGDGAGEGAVDADG